MKVIVSHPTGNRNVRAVLAALDHVGSLSGFHGALAFGRTARWPGFLPGRMRVEMERRRYDLPDSHIHSHPLREAVRLAAVRFGWRGLLTHERGWACVDRVYADLDRAVARCLEAGGSSQAVYAYEDGAFATFTRAAELGIPRAYDLPIAYWETLRRLITEEGERLPRWAATLGGGLSDSKAKLERKTRELELADLVVTPSRFVADSLPAWALGKLVLVTPFGSPPTLSAELEATSYERRARRSKAGEPLRVLFAGSMGQRKGLGDLMMAVRSLGRRDVELVVMGSLQAEQGFYNRECPGFIHESGRPHAQVLDLMRSCDVFCLPSIVEGRALVMQEAMSQGLPIIITPNTGGEDLVSGENLKAEMGGFHSQVSSFSAQHSLSAYGRSATGFLVPIRSPEKIAEAIAWCADHRAETIELGHAARLKAADYTWEAYGNQVVDAIKTLLTFKIRT